MTNSPKPNRFLTAKTVEAPKEDSKTRFAAVRSNEIEQIVQQVRDPTPHKATWKGKRRMFSARLPETLFDEIAFIAFVSQVPQGEICETALVKEAKERLEILKEEHGEANLKQLWNIFAKQK